MVSVHPSVRIHPTARIDCAELSIGAGGVIGANCVLEGTRINIGRELWMDEGARIGGGSCHDPQAFLQAGDWLHVGKSAELNIARGITIGDEVGIGIGSGLFTHGAYLDELAGFPCAFAPIAIGSRVWLPNAQVNPGVIIGSDVVVAARSVVNDHVLDGSLVGGTPAKLIQWGAFPKQLSTTEKTEIISRIVDECRTIMRTGEPTRVMASHSVIMAGVTDFDTDHRTITGPVTFDSEIVRNQLRRRGIRFRFEPSRGRYEPWAE